MNKIWVLTFCLCLALAACRPAQTETDLPTTASPERLQTAPPQPPPTLTLPAPPDTPLPTLEVQAGGVLVILGPQYDHRFYEGLRQAIERAGFPIYVASDTLEPIEGVYSGHGFESGNKTAERHPKASADLLLGQVKVADFEALVFLMGYEFAFYKTPEVRQLVKAGYDQGKVIGVNDLGIYLPASLGMLEGVKVTSTPLICQSMQADYGAICTDRDVEHDGQIITANATYPSIRFAKTLLKAIQ